TLTHLTDEKKDGDEKVVSTIEEWKKKCVEYSNQSIDALVNVISRCFDSMFVIFKNADISHIRRALRTLDFERSQSFEDENIAEISIRSLMYGVMESIHLTFLHLTEKMNRSKTEEEISNEENHLPTSTVSIDNSHMDSTHSINQLSTIPNFTTNLQSKMKDEPVKSSQSIPEENKKSAMEVFRQVIKQEEMENYDMSFGSDFSRDEIKEEDILNDEKEPKDESIDDLLLDEDDDQKFHLDFKDDEIKFKEPILNANMGNNLGDQDYMASDVIDNGEEKEKTVDNAAKSPAGSFNNDVFGGDQMESMDEPMLNEDMGNEDCQVSGDLIENDRGGKE
ncbi:hypothetical protein PMAYCL1PPCAC_01494, partial [Pristionchus mayeri]